MVEKEKPRSRVIKGIRGLFKRNGEAVVEHPLEKEPEEIINEIGRKEIAKILPHRGRMLLLERVTLTTHRLRGELLVTEEICEGHAVADGKAVLKGSDLYDMAAQLLGVWAAQRPAFQGKWAAVRRYGEAKFQGFISVDDLLVLEINVNNLRGEITIRPKLEKVIITGTSFSAKVQGIQKAYIAFVELTAF